MVEFIITGDILDMLAHAAQEEPHSIPQDPSRVKVVVLPQQPWIHAIYQQDGIHNPNQTLCGIERDIRRKFFDTKKDFFDFAELLKLKGNSGIRFSICGVCWWRYCYGE